MEEEVAAWHGGIVIREGGYLLLGSSWEAGKQAVVPGHLEKREELRVRLVRVSSDGSLQWMETYGQSYRSWPLALSASADGGVCVLAGVDSGPLAETGRLWVFKAEGGGVEAWNTYLEGMYKRSGMLARNYETFSIAGTKDGGCIVVGGTATELAGYMQARAVLIDSRGRALWDRAYGPKEASVGLAVAATETGFFVGGATAAKGGDTTEALLLRLDAAGTLLSEKRFGEARTKKFFNHVLPLPDGGALLSGSKVRPPNIRRDAWMLRVDRDGRPIWANSIGDNSGNLVFHVRSRSAGQFELFGVSGYAPRSLDSVRALVVTVDESGKVLEQQRFVQPIEELLGIVPLVDGGFLLLGAGLKGPKLVWLSRDGSPVAGR
jgi:hypothetical protein